MIPYEWRRSDENFGFFNFTSEETGKTVRGGGGKGRDPLPLFGQGGRGPDPLHFVTSIHWVTILGTKFGLYRRHVQRMPEFSRSQGYFKPYLTTNTAVKVSQTWHTTAAKAENKGNTSGMALEAYIQVSLIKCFQVPNIFLQHHVQRISRHYMANDQFKMTKAVYVYKPVVVWWILCLCLCCNGYTKHYR